MLLRKMTRDCTLRPLLAPKIPQRESKSPGHAKQQSRAVFDAISTRSLDITLKETPERQSFTRQTPGSRGLVLLAKRLSRVGAPSRGHAKTR